jgi:uncharacterized protein YjdB
VTSISVTGAGGSSLIASDNGTLQLTATITPTDATNKTVPWSIVNGTGQATISTTGLVTAITSGTVTARATVNDGSGIYGALIITITNQIIPITSIAVTGAGGSSLITSDEGTLQLTATVSPTDATNKTVIWSIVNGTGQATISTSGLVTAITSGTVTARATANDGSGVDGTLILTISKQVIPVTSIVVTGAGGSSTIAIDNGTLQLTATVLPLDAMNKTVTWSIVNGTGQATISTTGLVTAITSGTVTARATANDGSYVYGTMVVTIGNLFIPVTNIEVRGAAGSSTIPTDNGTLQLTATLSPSNATNQEVRWSVINGTGQATISTTGLVTALSSGTVTARASSLDGSEIRGTLFISIGSNILVSGIAISGANGITAITTDKGTLQLTSTISPSNATDQTVTWSIINGTGQATISTTGLVTAQSSGTVTARAEAKDGSEIRGQLIITITDQVVPVSDISLKAAGVSTVITSEGGMLQLVADVNPIDATNKTVNWSIIHGTGQAEISPTGIVTAISNGTVKAIVTANDESRVSYSLDILINFPVFRTRIRDNIIEVIFEEDHSGHQLDLYNSLGQLFQKNVINGTKSYFDIGQVSDGVYLIVLSKSGIASVRKISIAR